MSLKYQPLAPAERLYAYRQSRQLTQQTGVIGYLRGDFGKNGAEFHAQFFDEAERRKTDAFRADIGRVAKGMRQPGGPLRDRYAMLSFCGLHESAAFKGNVGKEYGFRVDTENYTYLLRCHPAPDDYNFFLKCYDRFLLESHMALAEHGIRFITPFYREKFRIPDGDRIRILDRDGNAKDRVCRYIDDYHLEVGNSLYHICEFAEMTEQLGASVIPLRSSLPEQCFAALKTEDGIIRIRKGEAGYERTDILPDPGQTRQQAADAVNEALGVGKDQAAAMLAGSLFGWDVPAADPAYYDEKGIPVRPEQELDGR